MEQLRNFLPYDGAVYYVPDWLVENESAGYFEHFLTEIDWQHDIVHIFGKRYVTGRKVAWYGSQPYAYTYSKSTRYAKPWTSSLRDLRKKLEKFTGKSFDTCLLNLYHNGQEGMGWHSDDEPELKKNGTIASVSLGEARPFSLRHKALKERIDLLLQPGSLLLMEDETQQFWQHSLPKRKRIHNPRINLTFRQMAAPFRHTL